jgi:hypothetical protein
MAAAAPLVVSALVRKQQQTQLLYFISLFIARDNPKALTTATTKNGREG